MISSRCDSANALAVTIRPPFEERAKAAIERSISSASRTLIALTSTPDGRRHGLDYGELADPGSDSRIPQDRRSRDTRSDLLEQLQPLSAQAVLELHKAGSVAARPRQAIDEACANRIGDVHEHDWHAPGRLQQRLQRRGATCKDDVRRQGNQVS